MAQPQKLDAPKRNDPKTTMSLLKWTTTLSAVSLTLAGWGLLARAEAVNAASLTQTPAVNLALGSVANTPTLDTSLAAAGVLATSKKAASAAPAAAPNTTAAPTAQATAIATAAESAAARLDVVKWVQNQAGDKIAVVRDRQEILWYVWGDDLPRIEQGLSPEYQPIPVNQVGRSRHS
jgi:hypothetical protein